jgi:hypothetical protein
MNYFVNFTFLSHIINYYFENYYKDINKYDLITEAAVLTFTNINSIDFLFIVFCLL